MSSYPNRDKKSVSLLETAMEQDRKELCLYIPQDFLSEWNWPQRWDLPSEMDGHSCQSQSIWTRQLCLFQNSWEKVIPSFSTYFSIKSEKDYYFQE